MPSYNKRQNQKKLPSVPPPGFTAEAGLDLLAFFPKGKFWTGDLDLLDAPEPRTKEAAVAEAVAEIRREKILRIQIDSVCKFNRIEKIIKGL